MELAAVWAMSMVKVIFVPYGAKRGDGLLVNGQVGFHDPHRSCLDRSEACANPGPGDAVVQPAYAIPVAGDIEHNDTVSDGDGLRGGCAVIDIAQREGHQVCVCLRFWRGLWSNGRVGIGIAGGWKPPASVVVRFGAVTLSQPTNASPASSRSTATKLVKVSPDGMFNCTR